MRASVILLASFAATSTAFAHPGHIDALGGHDHFIVLGAAALALVIGVGATVLHTRAAKR